MKAAALVLGMMLAATSLNAQIIPSDRNYFADATQFGPNWIARAEKAYGDCLQSSNEGVVESALAHVAMMKLALPARGFSELESKVARLVKNAATPELRYKAYLALVALQHPEIFRNIGHQNYGGHDELYGVLANKLCNYSSVR